MLFVISFAEQRTWCYWDKCHPEVEDNIYRMLSHPLPDRSKLPFPVINVSLPESDKHDPQGSLGHIRHHRKFLFQTLQQLNWLDFSQSGSCCLFSNEVIIIYLVKAPKPFHQLSYSISAFPKQEQKTSPGIKTKKMLQYFRVMTQGKRNM